MGGSVRYGTAGINNINFYLVPEVPVVCISIIIILLLFQYYIINLKKNNKGR